MKLQQTLQNRRKQTKSRVRYRIKSDSQRPRLSVHISLTQVSAQIIDDTKAHTICAVSSIHQKNLAKASMTDKSIWVGEEIGKLAKAKKISTVIFDRGYRRYHGRVKALADAARKEGLKF